MRLLLKKLIGIFFFATGAYFVLQWWYGSKKNRAVVLMYHRIIDDALLLNPHVVSASVEAFEQQMQYLSKHYHVVSAEEFAKMTTIPPKTVVITFDDGYADNYTNAFPILKKYALPAIIFLTTGNMDAKQLFWWDQVAYAVYSASEEKLSIPQLGEIPLDNKETAVSQICEYLKTISNKDKEAIIAHLVKDLPRLDAESLFLTWEMVREMQTSRITFGAHTLHHPILTRVSDEAAIHEITESKRRIEEATHTPVTMFAYPNGTAQDMSPVLDDAARALGITHIFTTKHGINQGPTPLLNRMGIDHTDDMRMFRLKLLGLF